MSFFSTDYCGTIVGLMVTGEIGETGETGETMGDTQGVTSGSHD